MLHNDNQPSETERLVALEEATQFQRKLLLALLVLAAITTAIAIALGVGRMVRPPSSYVTADSFITLQKEVDKVVKTNLSWQARIDELSLELTNSQANTFQTLMLEQEQSYQLHLVALKEGMKDMAHMVPGSRVWLEIYNEKMDVALAQSNARMKKLAALQTSRAGAIETENLIAPDAPPLAH